MARFARISEGMVFEVFDSSLPISEAVHPSIADEFIEIGEGISVFQGDAWTGKGFAAGAWHLEAIRQEQAARVNAVVWKWERHRQQLELGVHPSLTEEQYAALLIYVQALRDVDTSGAKRLDQIVWPNRPAEI